MLSDKDSMPHHTWLPALISNQGQKFNILDNVVQQTSTSLHHLGDSPGAQILHYDEAAAHIGYPKGKHSIIWAAARINQLWDNFECYSNDSIIPFSSTKEQLICHLDNQDALSTLL